MISSLSGRVVQRQQVLEAGFDRGRFVVGDDDDRDRRRQGLRTPVRERNRRRVRTAVRLHAPPVEDAGVPALPPRWDSRRRHTRAGRPPARTARCPRVQPSRRSRREAASPVAAPSMSCPSSPDVERSDAVDGAKQLREVGARGRTALRDAWRELTRGPRAQLTAPQGRRSRPRRAIPGTRCPADTVQRRRRR